MACLAIAAGASFGISFGVKYFKAAHLAAKILIPLTITIITTMAAISIEIILIKCFIDNFRNQLGKTVNSAMYR